MRISLVLVALSFCYGIAAGNLLWSLVKGVSEGIEDSLEGDKGIKVKEIKEKFEKRIEEHPKFKVHKHALKKLIKKAGEDIDQMHKKLVRRYGSKGAHLAKEKYNKHIDAINKWMSTLTKNDTDGEEEHGIPFLPRLILHKGYTRGNKKKEKIFEGLVKMWESKLVKNKEDSVPKEDLFGYNNKKDIPEFVKENPEKEKSTLGDDELKNLHKIDLSEKVEKTVLPKFVDKEMRDFSKKEMLDLHKELKEKQDLVETGKIGKELLGQTNEEREQKMSEKADLMKIVSKESDDLEKTVEELLPFLGEGVKKEDVKIEPKEIVAPNHGLLTGKVEMINQNPIIAKSKEGVEGEEDKSKSEELEEEMMSTKRKFMKSAEKEMELEKKVTEEQKMFKEAEKMWISEIQKNAMEQIKRFEEKKQKTTEEKEVEEELKEPHDTIFTPPDEVVATVEPETKKEEEFRPIIYFNFDEVTDGTESKKEDVPVEKVLPLPRRVKEPASLFNQKKEPGSAFEEMSPEVKPLFQRLDDAMFRKKVLKEEKHWMKLKKWAANNLLKQKKGKDF